MKNRLFATAAAAASALAIAAAPALLVRCGNGSPALAGRWDDGNGDSLVLLSDGRGVEDGDEAFTWKAEGGRLYIFHETSGRPKVRVYDYSLSGTTLELTRGNRMIRFTKQKK
jgi:hypothetical protein